MRACRPVLLLLWLCAVGVLGCPGARAADEPPLPATPDPGGVAVALVDTGVNYTLPHIAARLARASDGTGLGYDFQDDDRLPFDLEPGRTVARGKRHGTRVATVLLREAPTARLVPFRYKAGSFETFARIVERIAAGPARIVAMPLGGYKEADWQPLRRAMAAQPQLLFVLSAGNEGRDIDERPVYPAAFGLANALVVTSSDAFGRLAPGSNWGGRSVDVSTPGERLQTIDHAGLRTLASGSSFAVPRIAALAARFKAAHPEWSTRQLKQAIVALAVPTPGEPTTRIRYGWIPNPALVEVD